MSTRKMNRVGGFYMCLMCLHLFQGVSCLVELELSVLQFDNPLGTSYTGQTVGKERKCCDSGGGDCRSVTDKCDVYFTFCIGTLSQDPDKAGCNGTSIDMQKDVSKDVLRIIDNRNLQRVVSVKTWEKANTMLIVNVLDIDELPSTDDVPHIFPDLIDAFNKPINFDPAPNYWSAKVVTVPLIGHVSLDLHLRAWCSRGWYGKSCDRQCLSDYFHTCGDGNDLPHIECTDPDASVLSVKQNISTIQNSTELRRTLVDILANDVCLKTTDNVTATIREVREYRGEHIDIVFTGYCDNIPVSSLKFREVVYVMTSVKTRLTPLDDYFGVPVLTPKFRFIPEDNGHVVVLVRIVKYTNLASGNCSSGTPISPSSPCNPTFNVYFSGSTQRASGHALQTNSLTDCNGDVVDLGKKQTPANTFNSTTLFVLHSFPASTDMVVEIGNLRTSFKAVHHYSTQNLVVGTDFYDAYPKRFPKSTNQNTELTMEIMAWCTNCWQGDRCEREVGGGCDAGVTTIPPDCRTDIQCKNGGRCAEKKTCLCKPGWTGPICNTDIDECALDICVHADSCTNTRGGYTCTCSRGFTGTNCDTDIDECTNQPCVTGLACVNTFGGYQCIGVCQNNKVSENCTGTVDFCNNQPCLNNGTCTNQAFNFTCDCAAGWTGSTCDVNIDECTNTSLCNNGGLCQDTPGSFHCACPSNYTGSFCDIDVDECLDPSSCNNNGTCNNNEGGFSCNCTGGFRGDTCSEDVDECTGFNSCQNGICFNTVGSYTCSCLAGWEGPACKADIDECLEPTSCNNDATCINQDGGYKCLCNNGFTGTKCESDVNECQNNPCVNGDCHNRAGGYNCSCYPGWSGAKCEVDRDECLFSDPCINGGVCVNTPGSFICNCTEFWTGEHCQTDVNECVEKYACNFNGHCTNLNGSFSCSCFQGWTGVTCTDDIDECLTSVCNNGVCNNTDGGYACVCPSNWQGKTCDQDVDECSAYAPCQHSGTCRNTVGSYSCSCPKNWVGDNCTDDFDECLLKNPCQNGGSCNNTDGSYTCNCPPKWTGDTCQTDVNECRMSPCVNNGSCTNIVNGYSCACPAAWTGPNCTANVDECSIYSDICKHGVCKDTFGSYSCDCISGYTGQNCTIDVNECGVNNACKNSATCENTAGSYICRCTKYWTGQNCTIDINECESQNPCHNGGVCLNTDGGFHCQCDGGWTGNFCEHDVNECTNSPCKNGGRCSNNDGSFRCACADGWNGNLCEGNIDDCLTAPCQNGGKCQDLVHDFKCVCTTGYTGKSCDTDIKECASSPCQHGGVCHDHVGYFECVCPKGWNGTLCSNDVDECRTHPCEQGKACQNNPGSYVCITEHFGSVTAPKTTPKITGPNTVDVFSLQFTGPISQTQRPQVQKGISDILKLLTCHDSTNVYVSLIHNSVNTPDTVEFHAQCDGHHLTNSEVNSAIRTLSSEKLATYFPVQLANTQEQESWIASHIPVVGGAAGGAVVLVIIIVAFVCYRRKKNVEPRETINGVILEEIEDMDGRETITIRNPVYDSLYPTQTQI